MAETEPLTWKALQVIRSRVAQITTPAGYFTNLGAGTVTLNPKEIGDDPAYPYTTIVAGEIPINEESTGNRTIAEDMDVTIEYAIPMGYGDNPEFLAHQGRADIVRALRGGLRGSLEGLRSIAITGSRVGQTEDGSRLVIAQVTARAALSEKSTPPAN